MVALQGKPDPKNKADWIAVRRKEYEQLKKDSYMLLCLQDAGVDNWGQVHYAYEMYNERYPDDE